MESNFTWMEFEWIWMEFQSNRQVRWFCNKYLSLFFFFFNLSKFGSLGNKVQKGFISKIFYHFGCHLSRCLLSFAERLCLMWNLLQKSNKKSGCNVCEERWENSKNQREGKTGMGPGKKENGNTTRPVYWGGQSKLIGMYYQWAIYFLRNAAVILPFFPFRLIKS